MEEKILDIHKSIREKFKELTGKENYKIYKSVYFIPQYPVLKRRILSACDEYGMTDFDKIKTILLRHVENCVKEKFPKYTRTLQYFIYGQKGKDCNLADEYFNQELLEEEELETLNRKSNKDLFG